MKKLDEDKKTLISEREIENLDLPSYFKTKNEELQRDHGEGDRKTYPKSAIAKSLGISEEMLRKKLNGQKPLTRDWLIAICASYGLDSEETDDALRIAGMPSLDPDLPNEQFIRGYFDSNRSDGLRQPIKLGDLNDALSCDGYPRLETDTRKSSTNAAKESLTASPYKVLRQTIRTYWDEGDRYDSFETAYDFRCQCSSVAILEKGTERFRLEVFADGALRLKTEADVLPMRYKSINETGDLKDWFSWLQIQAAQEQQRIDARINDTRNYKERVGADLKNDRIHIFYEQYNYSRPERNEFYLMEYVDGRHRLSVSEQSMFMREYLTVEEYIKHFHKAAKPPAEVYNSEEEIEALLSNPSLPHYKRDIMEARKRVFLRCAKRVDDTLLKIKNRELFIRNLDAIWDNPGEVCRYYGLLDEFQVTYDVEYGDIDGWNDEAELTDESGDKIRVAFEEIKRAFELGYKDVEQICQILKMSGSVESVLF